MKQEMTVLHNARNSELIELLSSLMHKGHTISVVTPLTKPGGLPSNVLADWLVIYQVAEQITTPFEPAGIPELLTPPNGSSTSARNITLRWQPGACGAPLGYNVRLDDMEITITGTNTSLPKTLEAGVHTWAVCAFNMMGPSDWSAKWTIEVIDTEWLEGSGDG